MSRENIEQLKKQYGITGHVSGFYSRRNKDTRLTAVKAAMDAALETSPNIGVPVALTSFVDEELTSVLFDPRNATEIYSEVKKGDWTTTQSIFKVKESTGSIAPYGDFSPDGRSGVNYNFPKREQCKFQTIIEYGDFETALSSEAKLNLVGDSQESAAITCAVAANYFYLFGVSGAEAYGILNDPNLNPAVVAKPGVAGQTTWEDKTTKEIYQDIIDLFARLVSQNKNITQLTPLKLAVPPSRNVQLGKATDFNVSVLDMVNKYFKKLDIITLPELEEGTSDASMMLTASNIMGENVGQCAFGEKFRLGRVIPDLTSFSQKAMFSTYGGVIKHPDAVANMTGI